MAETLDSINSDIKTILGSINDKNLNEVVVRFANRLLLSDAYNLTENFRNTVENEFNSSVDSVDFLGNAVNITDNINQWISDQTNGKINRLFESIANDTVFVIANALYFSARWKYPFDNYSTFMGLFYGSGDEPTSVRMMRQMRKFRYRSVPELNASLIELPFVEESNTSMIIVSTVPMRDSLVNKLIFFNIIDETTFIQKILPNERNGLNRLLKVLDFETLNSKTNQLLNGNRTQLNLFLPKFNLETGIQVLLKKNYFNFFFNRL